MQEQTHKRMLHDFHGIHNISHSLYHFSEEILMHYAYIIQYCGSSTVTPRYMEQWTKCVVSFKRSHIEKLDLETSAVRQVAKRTSIAYKTDESFWWFYRVLYDTDIASVKIIL